MRSDLRREIWTWDRELGIVKPKWQKCKASDGSCWPHEKSEEHFWNLGSGNRFRMISSNLLILTMRKPIFRDINSMLCVMHSSFKARSSNRNGVVTSWQWGWGRKLAWVPCESTQQQKRQKAEKWWRRFYEDILWRITLNFIKIFIKFCDSKLFLCIFRWWKYLIKIFKV
jgi:hypothetical protein